MRTAIGHKLKPSCQSLTAWLDILGWSSFVMGKFLDLCERAGPAYPILKFGQQANAALSSIGNAEEDGPERCCQPEQPVLCSDRPIGIFH